MWTSGNPFYNTAFACCIDVCVVSVHTRRTLGEPEHRSSEELLLTRSLQCLLSKWEHAMRAVQRQDLCNMQTPCWKGVYLDTNFAYCTLWSGEAWCWNSVYRKLFVYVITWSTVDYTSVTSIIHCRHVITILFHDCDKLRVRSIAAKRIGVGKMLSTCSEYNVQLSSWSCWWRLLFIVRLSWKFDLQFSFSDIFDDKNADYIKIWECCLPRVAAVCIIRRFVFHMA